MKLLVYTPTFGGGLRAECRASVAAQETAHEWEWIIDDADPFPTPDHRNVLAKYKRARERALAGGFDALVTVEHDNVLPSKALDLLAGTVGADVVYAPYVLRHNAAVLNTWQYIGNHALGMPLGLYPHELERYRKEGVGRVAGCGWGCTLIRRSVLERIPFHDGNGVNPPGDIQFAMDCLRAGVVAYGRFDCPVGHYTEKGQLLMPYEDTHIMSRVEALVDVTALVSGQPLVMVAGMRYSVPREEAWELARAGYVRIRQTEPETTTTPPEIERAILTPDAETAVSPVQRKRRKQ